MAEPVEPVDLHDAPETIRLSATSRLFLALLSQHCTQEPSLPVDDDLLPARAQEAARDHDRWADQRDRLAAVLGHALVGDALRAMKDKDTPLPIYTPPGARS